MSKIILAFILILAPIFSFADGYMRLGLLYLSDNSGTEGSTIESTRTLLDLGGGYIWPSGWTLGFLYGQDKTESGGSSSSRTAYGPTVGWVSNKDSGPYALFTYFIKAEREPLEGSGMQLDLGYKFAVRRFSFAPQLSYRNISYNKVAGATLNPKSIDKKIDPLFVVWIDF